MSVTTVSSREFNQDASGAKRAAQNGPVFITDRGRPVARIVPVIPQGYARLVAEGRIRTGSGRDILTIEPVALPPGATPPSELISRMRDE